MYNSINQQNEDAVKVSPLTFSKKVSVDALAKIFQTLIIEKAEKKQSGISVSNYNSITNQIKKAEPSTAIKAVRKMPISPQSTPSSLNQNKKKVSSKKDIHTPANQHQACIVINKVTPSPKERVDRPDLNCNELAQQIHNDISGVESK